MISNRPPRLVTYMFAVLLVPLVIGLTTLYYQIFGQYLFVFFYLAVFISTWYGGRYPGLATTILSLLAIWYFFIPPFFSWTLSVKDTARLGLYLAIMLVFNWLVAALLDSRHRVEVLSQNQIQQSEARWHQALQAANMGVWDYDLQTGKISWSPEHERLFGLAPGTFDGSYEGFVSLVHPEDRHQVQQLVQQAIAQKGDLTTRYRIVWADHSIHWVESRGQVICHLQGQALRLSGTVMNIDERIRTEQTLQQLNQELESRVIQRTTALQESEARYRAIVEDQTELIVRFLPDNTILFVNEAYCRYFGLQAEAVIGKSYAPIILEADREFVNQQVASISIDNPIVEIENRVVINGEVRWTQWITRLLSHQDAQLGELQAVGRDITHLKQIQESLQISEERLKLALEGSGIGLWDWNIATGEMYFDENWLQMLGYTEGELPAHISTWQQLIHPDDRPWVMDSLNIHLRDSQIPYTFEYRARTQSGDWKWVAKYGKVVTRAADGTPLRMVGIRQDVNDRKHVEEQLRDLSVRLTLALRSGAIGTWTWDLAHEVSWDNGMYELYGLQQLDRATTYEDWINTLHPDDRETTTVALQAARRGEKEFDTEFRIFHPDGSLHYIKAFALVQRQSQGEPQRMVGINYDITERKQAEQALSDYAHEIEDLYDNAPCGYHSLDQQGRYVRVNETELKLLGYSREEIIGRPITDFFTPASRIAFAKNYEVFQAQGWVQNLEYDMICKNGTILPVIISATIVKDAQGNPAYNRATLVDIRDRKQAEEQLRISAERISLANAELSRAARLKDEFLAGMSHELRTPLNAILGMSEVLLEEIHGSLTSSQRESVQLIERSGQHLLTLINDILDLAKVESGKMDLNITAVKIRTLCDASLSFVKQQAYQKHIHLACHVETGIDSVELDERRISQVLINLLSNAVKFTLEGGRVELSVRANQAQEAVEFAVSDTGIGIAADQLERLFQPFVQLDSSLSRRYSGTGLGLALVRRIVELHGGSVSVASETGQGSCFTVILPWQRGQQPPAVLETSPPPDASTLTIQRALLVEDSETTASQISRYLAEWGTTTVVHPLGRGAIDLALHHKPDVIILDVLLPDLPGWEVLMELKAHPVTRSIPVLIASVVDERAKGLALGATDYLLKPIARLQLQQVLQRLAGVIDPAQKTALIVTNQMAAPLVVLAEDNEANIAVVLNYLQAYGFRTAIARTGLEAVQLVKQCQPDLVLMDIQMPEMDGLEAIERIRADANLTALPIMALTALAMPGDRERCLTAGANEYLTKPVSFKQLLQVIHQYLPHHALTKR